MMGNRTWVLWGFRLVALAIVALTLWLVDLGGGAYIVLYVGLMLGNVALTAWARRAG